MLPAVDEFEPHLIIIPSGFDSCALDPLGMQMLSSADYRWMTRQLLKSADKHCEGRLIATHEGGYSATYVPYCGLAVIEELSGASECFEDPLCCPFFLGIRAAINYIFLYFLYLQS